MAIDTVQNIPTFTSTDSEWIAWHEALVKQFGKKQANITFLQAFNKRANTETANTSTLRAYAQSKGMNIEGAYLGSGVYDYVGATGSAFGGAFSSIGNSMMIGALIVIALFGFAMYKLFKS